jgi:hypothetical protein
LASGTGVGATVGEEAVPLVTGVLADGGVGVEAKAMDAAANESKTNGMRSRLIIGKE